MRHTLPMRLSRSGRALALLSVVLASLSSGCRKTPPPAVASVVATPDPYREAVRKVEEDRGEPTGRKAAVTVPAELKHYRNRQRFLSVQAAASIQHGYEVPRDYADLARLVRLRELVEVKPLGDHYVLYGVGQNEDDGPFTHFDQDTGVSVPLFEADDKYKEEIARLENAVAEAETQIALLKAELGTVPKRNRSMRGELARRIRETEGSAADLARSRAVLESYLKDHAKRRLLALEYESLAKLAAELEGQSVAFGDGASRHAFKVRLLSCARPEAIAIIEEVARSYREKFGRPLPITSLVRTEEYQRRLSRTNRNAARNSMPPHTTGLAFDVYYFYMTAEEQHFLMSEVARLKAAGRVEALRESRDHIHVFAFAGGRPPSESLVSLAMSAKSAKPLGKVAGRH